MSKKFQLAIIIPCFNEANRFHFKEYSNFISNNLNILICFVNDGSSDNTLSILNDLKKEYPNNTDIISYEKNRGKAVAVRKGMLYSLDNYNCEYLAYLDADLAVSLEECSSLIKSFNSTIHFCFGSRIARIGATIQRKRSRFLIGRVIATLISNLLSLKVYDTQCGCKLFTQKLAQHVFHEAFITTWLFDVEIFSRIIELYKNKCLEVMLEIPLVRWVDTGDSKVKYTYFFKVFFDLYQIKKKYNPTQHKH